MTKLLIVDDEQLILDCFRYAFPGPKYELITAMNATDAIKLFHSESPDVVCQELRLRRLKCSGVTNGRGMFANFKVSFSMRCSKPRAPSWYRRFCRNPSAAHDGKISRNSFGMKCLPNLFTHGQRQRRVLCCPQNSRTTQIAGLSLSRFVSSRVVTSCMRKPCRTWSGTLFHCYCSTRTGISFRRPGCWAFPEQHCAPSAVSMVLPWTRWWIPASSRQTQVF